MYCMREKRLALHHNSSRLLYLYLTDLASKTGTCCIKPNNVAVTASIIDMVEYAIREAHPDAKLFLEGRIKYLKIYY